MADEEQVIIKREINNLQLKNFEIIYLFQKN